MKIATYNIWNDEATLELRAKQILEEIRAVDADVIGMQEVSVEFYHKYLATEAGYVHHAFMQYPGEEEGLAILCRYPLIFLEALYTVHNPRFAGKKSIYAPEAMDRVYLMDHWNETELESVKLFGTEISKKTGYAASDHYGVMAEVNFRK